jgi:glycosyltransferase involved in cell wall biosynthesis
MRFAFVSTMHSAIWGGSEELWSQAARQLRREGHDVLASVVFWMRQSDRLKRLSQEGIQVEGHSLDEAGRVRRWREKLLYGGPKAYRDLKQFDPDLVVISQGSNSGGFDWARICRVAEIPYVIIVQCNNEHWWFGKQLGEANASYTAARRVFCVSRSNLDLLRSQLGGSLPNGEVVWNPYNVSGDRIAPWPDESGACRLACVARIELAAKGQDLLLKTLARPEWRDRPIELNLFGTGPDEEVLRRMAEALHLNNVHFRGHVSDIGAIWEQNHLLVLPSRFEGLPLALVEAMWCGRPQVVTDVGGNAEICVDGETGFVAEAPTLSAFSNALERAWKRRNEWQKLGETARARADSVIPKDPAALFCQRLMACATEASKANTGSK